MVGWREKWEAGTRSFRGDVCGWCGIELLLHGNFSSVETWEIYSWRRIIISKLFYPFFFFFESELAILDHSHTRCFNFIKQILILVASFKILNQGATQSEKMSKLKEKEGGLFRTCTIGFTSLTKYLNIGSQIQLIPFTIVVDTSASNLVR